MIADKFTPLTEDLVTICLECDAIKLESMDGEPEIWLRKSESPEAYKRNVCAVLNGKPITLSCHFPRDVSQDNVLDPMKANREQLEFYRDVISDYVPAEHLSHSYCPDCKEKCERDLGLR